MSISEVCAAATASQPMPDSRPAASSGGIQCRWPLHAMPRMHLWCCCCPDTGHRSSPASRLACSKMLFNLTQLPLVLQMIWRRSTKTPPQRYGVS